MAKIGREDVRKIMEDAPSVHEVPHPRCRNRWSAPAGAPIENVYNPPRSPKVHLCKRSADFDSSPAIPKNRCCCFASDSRLLRCRTGVRFLGNWFPIKRLADTSSRQLNDLFELGRESPESVYRFSRSALVFLPNRARTPFGSDHILGGSLVSKDKSPTTAHWWFGCAEELNEGGLPKS